jgi:hypothetical protein
MWMIPPCRFVSRSHSLMPALLPKSDEFAMNFEGLDTFFRHMRCFPQHFCELGVNFVEKWRPRQWEPRSMAENSSSECGSGAWDRGTEPQISCKLRSVPQAGRERIWR